MVRRLGHLARLVQHVLEQRDLLGRRGEHEAGQLVEPVQLGDDFECVSLAREQGPGLALCGAVTMAARGQVAGGL
jgi:hypothetical protein